MLTSTSYITLIAVSIIGEAVCEKEFLFPATGTRERPPNRRGNCPSANGRGDRRDLTPGQTGVVISQVAALQSQIISREVQLDALRTSSTDQNPEVIRMNSEMQGCGTRCSIGKRSKRA